MIKQKIIPIIICLLMVSVVTAADDFKINLVTYNSEAKSAQIGIENTGSEDHYDVYMTIDDLPSFKIVGLLRQGNAIKIQIGAPPGKHTITVSTPHGATTTKNFDFPRSQADVQKELENRQKLLELQGTEEKKTAQRVYEVNKKPKLGSGLIIIIMLALFLLLIYIIFKKKQ